jgi:kynurenine formamidase
MKVQTFVIGCVFALALFLFAQHRTETAQPGGFREVVDLTHPLQTSALEHQARFANRLQNLDLSSETLRTGPAMPSSEQFPTRIDAPSRLAQGMWTVDQIPAGRLIAPLVVLDASASARNNPDYEISVEDVVGWERTNGQIPLGAVIMARTGWAARWNSPRDYRNPDRNGVLHFPGYSEEAARFLAEGRNALGLGIDTPNVDHGSAKTLVVDQYTLARGVYVLTNVASLDRIPANGAIAMVAPMKVVGGSEAPVRILALVR